MQITTINTSPQFLGQNSSKQMNGDDSKTFESVMDSLLDQPQEEEEDTLLQSQQMLGQLSMALQPSLTVDYSLSLENQQVNTNELLGAQHLLGQIGISQRLNEGLKMNQNELKHNSLFEPENEMIQGVFEQEFEMTQGVYEQESEMTQEALQQSTLLEWDAEVATTRMETLIDEELVKEDQLIKSLALESDFSKKVSPLEGEAVFDFIQEVETEASVIKPLEESLFSQLSDVSHHEIELMGLPQDFTNIEESGLDNKRSDELIGTDLMFNNEIKQQEVPLRSIANELSSTPMSWVNQTQVMEAIEHQISMLKEEDSTTLTLKLYPEYLGNISVEMKMKNGVINANVILDNMAAKSAIEQAFHQINLDGASIEQLNVEVNAGAHQQGQFQNQNPTSSFKEQLDGVIDDESNDATADLSEIGRLNLIV